MQTAGNYLSLTAITIGDGPHLFDLIRLPLMRFAAPGRLATGKTRQEPGGGVPAGRPLSGRLVAGYADQLADVLGSVWSTDFGRADAESVITRSPVNGEQAEADPLHHIALGHIEKAVRVLHNAVMLPRAMGERLMASREEEITWGAACTLMLSATPMPEVTP